MRLLHVKNFKNNYKCNEFVRVDSDNVVVTALT